MGLFGTKKLSPADGVHELLPLAFALFKQTSEAHGSGMAIGTLQIERKHGSFFHLLFCTAVVSAGGSHLLEDPQKTQGLTMGMVVSMAADTDDDFFPINDVDEGWRLAEVWVSEFRDSLNENLRLPPGRGLMESTRAMVGMLRRIESNDPLTPRAELRLEPLALFLGETLHRMAQAKRLANIRLA